MAEKRKTQLELHREFYERRLETIDELLNMVRRFPVRAPVQRKPYKREMLKDIRSHG